MVHRKVQRWRALPAAERAVFWRAWRLLVLADLSLRLRPYAQVDAHWGANMASHEDVAAAQALARTVRLAARNHLYPMTCLRQSLVLRRLLAQHGLAGHIVFGARLQQGNLQAHAWVVHGQTPLEELPQELQLFQTFQGSQGAG
jgi:Transglutaminase-like superfamily